MTFTERLENSNVDGAEVANELPVAYVCADPGVPVLGRKGCSIHVQEVIRGFLNRGLRVKLFASSAVGEPPADWRNVEIVPIPVFRPEGSASLISIGDFNRSLQQTLERSGPFAFVYERYSLWSFAGMTHASSRQVPGLLEVNAPLIREQMRHRRPIDQNAAEKVAKKAFSAALHLIAVSPMVRNFLEEYPESRGRVRVISNGVDPRRFQPAVKPALRRERGAFTVGFVGSMKPWHGLEVLPKAFQHLIRRHPECRLILVGDGSIRPVLEKEFRKRRIDRAVHFTGSVSPARVPSLLASMDVGVAPYPQLRHFYFSPLKLYEYMAAGLAVVASRVGSLQELIHDGINGLLIPPGDPLALGESLESLCQDRSLRRRLGKAARATVLENHSWDGVVQKILGLGLPTSQFEIPAERQLP